MTQYAYFDHTQPAPSPVIGWYDTAAFAYPALPEADDLLELTPEEWAARLGAAWGVAAGALVAMPAPPGPSPAQQAMAALGQGLTVTSTGTPALDATYAVDAAAQAKMTATELYILKNGTFPGGSTTIAWPDIAGTLHTFPSTAVYAAWATAIADYVAALDLVIATDTGTLPAAAKTIA